MMAKNQRLATYITCAVVAIVLPLVLSPLKAGNFYLHILIIISLFTMMASGLNLLLGFTGQASIGHGAFYGIGAYTSALLVMDANFPFWLAFLAGGCAAGAAGALIGYPALRLKGISFAIVTFAVGELVRLIFVNWKNLTRGQDGVTDIPGATFLGIDFTAKLPMTYLALLFALLSLVLVDRIVNARVGKAFISIREDEDLAAATGVNVMGYKVLSFTISTFLAGLAGSLYAHYMRFINPADFTVMQSMQLIAMVVIGGLGTVMGPVVGAVVLLFLPELLRPIKDYYYLIFGLILILVMIFAPAGVMGGVKSLTTRYSKERA